MEKDAPESGGHRHPQVTRSRRPPSFLQADTVRLAISVGRCRLPDVVGGSLDSVGAGCWESGTAAVRT